MTAPAARALLLPAAMRAALSRLSHRAASSSSSAASAQQAAAQQAAAGLPNEARRIILSEACPLALGVVTDGGRALVARRPIRQGDTLFQEWPLAAAPSPQSDGDEEGAGGGARQCHHCLRLLAPGQGLPASVPAREAAIPEEEDEEEEEVAGETGDGTTAAAAPPPSRARDRPRNIAPSSASPSAGSASSSLFCGDACARAAEASYHRVERRADFSELRAHCARERERFPLVAARLACAVLQAWEAGGREQELGRARAGAGRGGEAGGAAAGGAAAPLRRRSWLPLRAMSAPAATTTTTTTTTTTAAATASPPAAAMAAKSATAARQPEEEQSAEDAAFVDAVAADAAASRLGPMAAVSYLCRANLPASNAPGAAAPLLPASWARSHALLVRALGAMLDAEPPNSAARLLPCARAVSSAQWYAGVLSRLHLNSFRVESAATAPLMAAAAAGSGGSGGDAGGGAAEDFAAALLRAASDGPAASALGSAVYSAASLFNHSCDPSADAAWPGGNARLRLTARRDVAPGEQVTIAYVDCSLGVEERRAFLEHAYGFLCGCERCADELASLPPDMPPLPR